MRVELTIDRTKKLPDGALPALEKEFSIRLENRFSECSLIIRRAGSYGLSFYGAENNDKKDVEQILQETWESAEDWFY